MKKLKLENRKLQILLLSVVPSLVLFGCESSVDHTFIIENETDHSIKIELYSRNYDYSTSRRIDNPVLSETILLAGNDEYIKRHTESMETVVYVDMALQADSAIITYDNSRIQIFVPLDGSDRNILHDATWEVEHDEVKNRVYIGTSRYTLTEEDFNNAEEIESGG